MQWKEVFRGTARVERNDFATMSGPPRVRTMNVCPEPDPRPVLGPTGNTGMVRRPTVKPVKKAESVAERLGAIESKQKNKSSSVVAAQSPKCGTAASFLRRQEVPMNASWSSDASSSSDSSRSSGRVRTPSRKKGSPPEEKSDSNCAVGVGDNYGESKKRCAWITPNTDPSYTTFHDEEWGVPVHDDKKLFELLSLSGALAELTWPVILKKRHIFREVFLDFDPIVVSLLNEKKFGTPASPVGSLLSELKLRSIIENACQMCKVVEEFGSFDKYIWSFVNHKPIVSQFQYSRQVPVRTPKAEVISKDLVRRGFRSVGPTVVYSFMQVAGLTNDHLTSCFRFQECISGAK